MSLFVVILVFTILLGCLVVAGVIYAFVIRKNKRKRNRSLVSALVSLVFLLLCVGYLTFRVVRATVALGNEAGKAVGNVAAEGLVESMTNRVSVESPQVKSLQSFEADSLRGKVDTSFYTYLGFRDWWRLPLMYPYSIHCVDVVNHGQLVSEKEVANVTTANDSKIRAMGVINITHLSFDKKLLLVRVQDTTAQYVLFDLADQNQEIFQSEAELLKKADLEGFSGPKKLESLQEYMARF
jgi:hypothetical protein